MTTPRIAGFTIAAAGIVFSVLTAAFAWLRLGQPWFPGGPTASAILADTLLGLATTGSLALAGAALIVLLFSRTVPRWWSLAYLLFALALLAVIIWREGEAASEILRQIQSNPDVLVTGWQPRLTDYVVIGLRLLLGVVASLAIGAPLLLPPRLSRPAPDVPQRPLGLRSRSGSPRPTPKDPRPGTSRIIGSWKLGIGS